MSEKLRKEVMDANRKFEKELMEFKVEKIVRNIVEKHKHRVELCTTCTDQYSQIVQLNLVNFPVYLKSRQKHNFSRWVLLSGCIREEHPAGLNLDGLPRDDFIF